MSVAHVDDYILVLHQIDGGLVLLKHVLGVMAETIAKQHDAVRVERRVTQLRIMLPCILVGVILIVFLIKPMDAFLLGEQEAQSVGVDVRNKRLMLIGLTVFLTGVSTAFTGPIGFVGIAVPHVSRLLLDTSIHRKIMPHSLLLGACMMLLSDIISQLPSNGYVIPINAITSLMGIPIVIWMVLGNNRIK